MNKNSVIEVSGREIGLPASEQNTSKTKTSGRNIVFLLDNPVLNLFWPKVIGHELTELISGHLAFS